MEKKKKNNKESAKPIPKACDCETPWQRLRGAVAGPGQEISPLEVQTPLRRCRAPNPGARGPAAACDRTQNRPVGGRGEGEESTWGHGAGTSAASSSRGTSAQGAWGPEPSGMSCRWWHLWLGDAVWFVC